MARGEYLYAETMVKLAYESVGMFVNMEIVIIDGNQIEEMKKQIQQLDLIFDNYLEAFCDYNEGYFELSGYYLTRKVEDSLWNWNDAIEDLKDDMREIIKGRRSELVRGLGKYRARDREPALCTQMVGTVPFPREETSYGSSIPCPVSCLFTPFPHTTPTHPSRPEEAMSNQADTVGWHKWPDLHDFNTKVVDTMELSVTFPHKPYPAPGEASRDPLPALFNSNPNHSQPHAMTVKNNAMARDRWPHNIVRILSRGVTNLFPVSPVEISTFPSPPAFPYPSTNPTLLPSPGRLSRSPRRSSPGLTPGVPARRPASRATSGMTVFKGMGQQEVGVSG